MLQSSPAQTLCMLLGSERACLGGFSLASACGPFRGTPQVEVDGSHEGTVAAVSQGCDHQASAVTQVLIPVLHLCIHHAHRDGQRLRVIVQVLAQSSKSVLGPLKKGSKSREAFTAVNAHVRMTRLSCPCSRAQSVHLGCRLQHVYQVTLPCVHTMCVGDRCMHIDCGTD